MRRQYGIYETRIYWNRCPVPRPMGLMRVEPWDGMEANQTPWRRWTGRKEGRAGDVWKNSKARGQEVLDVANLRGFLTSLDVHDLIPLASTVCGSVPSLFIRLRSTCQLCGCQKKKKGKVRGGLIYLPSKIVNFKRNSESMRRQQEVMQCLTNTR